MSAAKLGKYFNIHLFLSNDYCFIWTLKASTKEGEEEGKEGKEGKNSKDSKDSKQSLAMKPDLSR